jgi:hypothetical protein
MIGADTQHAVGLLWTNDQPDTETSTCNTHNLQETGIPAPDAIRTLIPSTRAATWIGKPFTYLKKHYSLSCYGKVVLLYAFQFLCYKNSQGTDV